MARSALVSTSALLIGLVPWMVETGSVSEEWAAGEEWTTYERRMLTGESLTHTLPEVREAITNFTRGMPKAELFEGGVARGITLAPVNTVADVMRLEQLEARHYWDELRLPGGRTLQDAGRVCQGVGDTGRVASTGARRSASTPPRCCRPALRTGPVAARSPR